MYTSCNNFCPTIYSQSKRLCVFIYIISAPELLAVNPNSCARSQIWNWIKWINFIRTIKSNVCKRKLCHMGSNIDLFIFVHIKVTWTWMTINNKSTSRSSLRTGIVFFTDEANKFQVYWALNRECKYIGRKSVGFRSECKATALSYHSGQLDAGCRIPVLTIILFMNYLSYTWGRWECALCQCYTTLVECCACSHFLPRKKQQFT